MTNKERAKDFADTLKGDPQAIVAWAKRERDEYSKLIGSNPTRL